MTLRVDVANIPSMSLESDPNRRIIDDPLAMRALAHPLRLKLCALVGREGSITAAEAARQLGVSQALASHHLRQLAKYGFVEPAEAVDNRERPWRVTATSYSVDHGGPSAAAEETWESIDLMERFLVDRVAAQLTDWQQRRGDQDPRWRDNTGVSQNLVYLTVEEAAELRQRWEKLITPLVQRRRLGDAASRPSDAVPVDVTLVVVPVPATPSGG
ncbi:helix-turn-helix domain-containing protein [Polymorphospora rubra]|uniref:Transcriptional regulator n=1 Tax=Polymorphospora rubra TaxID=338584 RepID=A0A810MR27_9ACTN|nr:helix-turn-helix domain-containing protein [Polymorphospora rubra]BCJ63521.1 transcriptional regulator [Polymorphospora rubra]